MIATITRKPTITAAGTRNGSGRTGVVDIVVVTVGVIVVAEVDVSGN